MKHVTLMTTKRKIKTDRNVVGAMRKLTNMIYVDLCKGRST